MLLLPPSTASKPPTSQHCGSYSKETHSSYNRLDEKEIYTNTSRAFEENGMSYDKKGSAGRKRSANDMAGGKGGQGRITREEAQRQNGWEDEDSGTYDRVYVSEAEMRAMARMANFLGTDGYLIHRQALMRPQLHSTRLTCRSCSHI